MDLIGQALVLAALGLPVFPCLADKSPACPTGFKAATRDPGAVARLFARYPGVLIGVVCGPRSGLAVLDVDVPKHPEAGLWLDANRARLPGRVFQTRSGGWHLYFRWVPGVVNCAGRPVTGIDARGEGGYVIWWGGDDLGRAAPQGIAEWPEWLRVLIWPPKPPAPVRAYKPPKGTDPLLPPLRKIEQASIGRRNFELFKSSCWAARLVKEGYALESEARGELLAAALYVGLPANDSQRTIQSAFRSEGL